ncbi:hypothetical protein C5F44_01310 [Fuscovulum blasticum DSM 2131]|uniref:Group 4 capsule polysaccharide lipoprotein gfcB, YjbF n=2 Tax=Fuscovulum blasticum TaxID=1075 RepID=A0A2T4JF41_FUSBL|nr:hypothetical protein C5F44_01310 [Fuscovulum blasticum DSM 2131]
MGKLLAMRRAFPLAVLLAAGLVLAGCGGKSPLTAVMGSAQKIIGGKKQAAPGRSTLTAAEIAAYDKPLMRVQIAALGLDSYLTLRDRDGDVATWQAPTGATFSLRDGVLIETRGLSLDLMSSAAPSPAQLARTGAPYSRTFFVSGFENDVDQRSYTCSTEAVPDEAPARRHLRHLRETCQRSGGKLTSDYWIDGRTVRASRQWAGPGAGFAVFETIKE